MPGKWPERRIELNVVRGGWDAGSAAKPTFEFPGHPAVCYRPCVPEFMWGMSSQSLFRLHYPTSDKYETVDKNTAQTGFATLV
jgi:hypothetical protein